MVNTDNKSIRSRTAFNRLIDRESNYIFVKEMSRYAYMDHRSTSFQGKSVNVDFFNPHEYDNEVDDELETNSQFKRGQTICVKMFWEFKCSE